VAGVAAVAEKVEFVIAHCEWFVGERKRKKERERKRWRIPV
jgi:hypothetical protein